MDPKLKKFLDQNKVKYELLEHKKVYTAFNEAETQHINLKEVAKTVLVKVDKGWVMTILQANKYVDFKAVQKALKAKKVSMAKESEITKYLKTKIGLLHPFGNLYKIPILLDKALAKTKKMIASAGSYTESLQVSLKDFEKLVKPIKGAFSKAKK